LLAFDEYVCDEGAVSLEGDIVEVLFDDFDPGV
jgi:hypothetical protein